MKNYLFTILAIATIAMAYSCSEPELDTQTENLQSDIAKYTTGTTSVRVAERLQEKSLENQLKVCKDEDENSEEQFSEEETEGQIDCDQLQEEIIRVRITVKQSGIEETIREIDKPDDNDDDAPCPEFTCPIQVFNGSKIVFATSFEKFEGEFVNSEGKVIGEFTPVEFYEDTEFKATTLVVKGAYENQVLGNIRFKLRNDDGDNVININNVLVTPGLE